MVVTCTDQVLPEACERVFVRSNPWVHHGDALYRQCMWQQGSGPSTPLSLLETLYCYAKRYGDLFTALCHHEAKASLATCDWASLRRHFDAEHLEKVQHASPT